MEDTGNGASEVVTECLSTEAASIPSAPKGKRSTKKEKTDPKLVLELLEDILSRCKEQGWEVLAGNFYEDGGQPRLGIVIDGVVLEGNKLVPLTAK